MLKDLNVKTKLIGGLLLIDVLAMTAIYTGYYTSKMLISGVDDSTVYLGKSQFCIMLLFLAMVAATVFIAFGVIRVLCKDINTLCKDAEKIALGDCNIAIKKRSNDEIGQLAERFQKIVNNRREQALLAEKIANGDLTVKVTPHSDADVLGKALEMFVNKNCQALTDINDAAFQVMTSSTEVASASEALAQGSTQQASAIQEITASINDIALKTKENAEEADKAAKLMEDAIADVNAGKEDMQEMMQAMEDINLSSESISKIIKVIDDIAFQTNILALNAAVEAARAGEAGKGFAVVAEEVRSLAAKSAAAAAETADMIQDSIAKVEAGSRIADETSQAIQSITDVVLESGKIVTGIATASNQQATAITQVDQAIEQVSQVVQNNSATSEQCAAASVQLSSQAEKMTGLLSVYELGENHKKNTCANYNKAKRNEQLISLGGGFGKY